jgi:hypothetical protein
MYRPGEIMKCGGSESDESGVSIATAEIIDLNGAAQWSETGSMNVPRRRHNTTMLPDGTVLATGGTRLGNSEFETDGTCGGTDDGAVCTFNSDCDEDVACLFNPAGEQQWVPEALGPG